MTVTRWEGMTPQGDTQPGCVWWHSEVTNKEGNPSGVLFEAPPDATEEQLRAAAAAKWAERSVQ